jgi:hypothetical protein
MYSAKKCVTVMAQVTHIYSEKTTRINLIDKRRGLKKERGCRLFTVNPR